MQISSPEAYGYRGQPILDLKTLPFAGPTRMFLHGAVSITDVAFEHYLPGLGIITDGMASGSISRLLLTEHCFLVAVSVLVDTLNVTAMTPLSTWFHEYKCPRLDVSW